MDFFVNICELNNRILKAGVSTSDSNNTIFKDQGQLLPDQTFTLGKFPVIFFFHLSHPTLSPTLPFFTED